MNPVYFKSSNHLKDYLSQKEDLSPFYKQSLYPDWVKLAKEVSGNFKQSAIIDELISQNKDSGDKQCLDNCTLLKKKNTVCVVTGQQLGLMISPLYIIYKTLSTIFLSERLNKQVDGFNFIPVFWLEGEDHDFEEVKSLNVFEKTGGIKRFSLEENNDNNNLSVNKRQLNDDISNLLIQLKESMQSTEFSESLFGKLEIIYKPGVNWLDSFKEHMEGLFKGSGLLFFNAGSQKIKELSQPFFKEVLLKNKELLNSFKSQSANLEKAGYKNQVTIQDEKAYLFLNRNGKRQSLLSKGDHFGVKETNEKFSLQQMLELLGENPEHFSSTVLTRPLWQSWLLPTVSYIAGGAEIAYWGQISKGFEILNLVMPHIQPRHSFTLIEPKIERLASKYKLDILAIDPDKSEFLKNYFINNQLGDVNDVLSRFESFASKNSEEVIALVEQIDPTLIGPSEKSYSTILATINKLQDRLSNRVKEKEVTIQNHLNAIHEAILPEGKLQERVLSSVYLENKYGEDWVLKIKNQISENFEEHLIVKL